MTDIARDAATTDIPLPGEDRFELRNWPFYWLVRAHGQYMASLEKVLKSIDLDIPKWRVLMLLGGDRARSVSYLAREAITKLSTMTRILQRMQDDGLVETWPRASDQRVTDALLTDRGRVARVLALEKTRDIYERAFRGLSSAEVDMLNAALSRLYRDLC